MTAKIVFDAQNIVGESIVWDDRHNRLVWVDIIGRRIHAFTPDTGRHELWEMAERPTSIGLRKDGGALVGTERHVCRWEWEGQLVPICEVEPSSPENRLNEGVVAPDGSFWIGTMQNNIAENDDPMDISDSAGRIYRLAPDGTLSQICSDIFGITNTFVWLDGNRFITADTMANELYSYHIGANGVLSDRKIFQGGFERGLPDGSTLDAEGFIWTARVAGGACLTRTSPSGEIDRVIDLPCTWPTSCTFGGTDLATLFVTSARFTMNPEHLAKNPQEGALFAIDVGVKGVNEHRYG